MRTDLSEKHVAMTGKSGCAAVCQARENEGGVRVERRVNILRHPIGVLF